MSENSQERLMIDKLLTKLRVLILLDHISEVCNMLEKMEARNNVEKNII